MSIIISDKCIGCGQCIEVCARNCLSFEDGHILLDLSICNECAHCYAICPVKAISFTEYTDKELDRYNIGFRSDSLTPESLLGLMSRRRSMRKYTNEPVNREIIENVLKAGSLAPCACNFMHNKFIVIQNNRGKLIDGVVTSLMENGEKLYPDDDEQTRRYRKQIWEETQKIRLKDPDNLLPIIYGAPVVILVVSPSVRDGAIAAAYMELAADAYGLGTLYNGYIPDAISCSDRMRKEYNIKDNEEAVIALLMGKPGRRFLRCVPRKLNCEFE